MQKCFLLSELTRGDAAAQRKSEGKWMIGKPKDPGFTSQFAPWATCETTNFKIFFFREPAHRIFKCKYFLLLYSTAGFLYKWQNIAADGNTDTLQWWAAEASIMGDHGFDLFIMYSMPSDRDAVWGHIFVTFCKKTLICSLNCGTIFSLYEQLHFNQNKEGKNWFSIS
jgi:hypothetical protein